MFLECQGWGDPKKRRDVMNYLRKQNFSIICLQDTHFTKNMESLIRSEWGNDAYFSSFSSQSRGVAIFLNNNFEYKVHNCHKDLRGNTLILDIEIDNNRMTLVNLYGPNNDEPTFYQNLQKLIIQQGNRHMLLVGDWNLLLDPPLDGHNYKHINNPNARQEVLKMMTELNLYDVWREENGDKKAYTWRRKLKPSTIQMGRLDFFLVSDSLANYTRDEKIRLSYRSDHSIISLSLVFHEMPKPKSYWKFNNSLLKVDSYTKEIKDTITKVKQQYAATPYNLNNIETVDNNLLQLTINPQLFFDILLLEIRSKTISLSVAFKKNESKKQELLQSEIKMLEDEDPTKNYDIIKEKEEDLRLIREKQLEGSLVRSRARWVEQGEKSSRYFCNLENRNFTSKRMTSLVNRKGEEITEYNHINNEVYNFYKNLYSNKESEIEDVDLDQILSPETPKLTDNEAFSLEGHITFKEAQKSLNKMKNNRSPGSSGFSVEFFKHFWEDLGHFLVKSINYGFDHRELSITQKEGIITCIPKGTKSKKYLKNWRPISLLNVSYKIASGCIANRIKHVLPIIIDFDQTGFMEDRFMGDNIRIIYDILSFGIEQKKTGLLLLIDFEKAFDSIAWSFIRKSFVYFNFKNDIIQWIETFYNNIKSTVIVNGNPTSWFPVERGCRQGDPISPYIFLVCSEILAHMIRQNPHIKGYEIFGKEIVISQLADDTSLFLDGSQESFEYCVHTILEYAKYSGLAMNFDKTKCVWFGCEHPPDTIYMPHLHFEWNPLTFRVLGVDFTVNLKDITDININNKITEITKALNTWSKRNLTPIGKIVVLKTLIVSKIVHLLISLPTPSNKTIKDLNSLFYQFLWDGKPDKIKRETLKQKLENGGLSMIDIELFDQSLKLAWVRRLFTSKSKWKIIIETTCPKILDIYKYGNAFAHLLENDMRNLFWKNVLEYYTNFSKKYYTNSSYNVNSCSFMYNDNIRIGKSYIKNNTLIQNNVHYIFQLKNREKFLSHQDFTVKYNININFLIYNSIISSVKNYGAKFQEQNKTLNFQAHFNLIMNTKKGVSTIYQELLRENTNQHTKTKWQTILGITIEQWKNSFNLLKSTTTDSKLIWFQLRILHNSLTTNRSVSKFKTNQTDTCQFCQSHSETIHHLLWKCTKVQTFWKELAELINRRCTVDYTINESTVIIGHNDKAETNKMCNFITLLAKHYIYRSKVQKTNLSLRPFIRELHNRCCIEKHIHGDSTEFRKSWNPFMQLFQSLL